MSDTVQQIKDRLSIVDVVSQYVKLERAGSTLRARCPFHSEKTPSFFVSPDRGTYHCFGCGVGGDIFSFIEQIEGVDFKGALKVLAEKAGVEIVYERGGKGEKDERQRLFELMEVATIFYSSRLNEAAKRYLRERGVQEPTIKVFRVGWAGNEWSDVCDLLKAKGFSEKEILEAGVGKKNERGGLTDKFRNRIMFPLNDSAGRVIAFSGRSFGEHASPEAPKYLNSPETPLFRKSRILYGFDKAKLSMRKLGCAVLVEGQMDLVMSHQAGWGNTVAVSGTAFTAEHAQLIRRMTDNLVIALDADEAGVKAAARAAREALRGGLNVKVARLPAGADPADLILKQGQEAWKEAIRDAKDIITFLLDVLQERAPQADKFRRSVEAVVLPFLSDVASPIARDAYIREISQRLRVSPESVAQALQKQPAVPEFSNSKSAAKAVIDPARQAFALLLVQRASGKPLFDVDAYASEIAEAIGDEALKALEHLPEDELEALRFSAERLHAESRNIAADARALLIKLLEQRLGETIKEERQAEVSGEGNETARIQKTVNLLTTKIARLRDAV